MTDMTDDTEPSGPGNKSLLAIAAAAVAAFIVVRRRRRANPSWSVEPEQVPVELTRTAREPPAPPDRRRPLRGRRRPTRHRPSARLG